MEDKLLALGENPARTFHHRSWRKTTASTASRTAAWATASPRLRSAAGPPRTCWVAQARQRRAPFCRVNDFVNGQFLMHCTFAFTVPTSSHAFYASKATKRISVNSNMQQHKYAVPYDARSTLGAQTLAVSEFRSWLLHLTIWRVRNVFCK